MSDHLMDHPSLELESLERRISAITSASDPPAVFRALLEGSRDGAPRIAAFLVRKDSLKGWGAMGYPAEAVRRLHSLVLDQPGGWLERAVAADRSVPCFRDPGEEGPDFGQQPSYEAVALPIRLGGRTVAVLLAERDPGESPWLPPLLGLLAQVASLRLELDLAWRKLKGLTSNRVTGEGSRTGPPAGAAAAPQRSSPDGEAAMTELQAVPDARRGRESAADDEAATDEAARRFAHLVATEVRIYNEEAVVQGRRNHDLADRLAEQIARGRDTFLRRYPDMGDRGFDLLREAFVEVLAGGDPTLLPDDLRTQGGS